MSKHQHKKAVTYALMATILLLTTIGGTKAATVSDDYNVSLTINNTFGNAAVGNTLIPNFNCSQVVIQGFGNTSNATGWYIFNVTNAATLASGQVGANRIATINYSFIKGVEYSVELGNLTGNWTSFYSTATVVFPKTGINFNVTKGSYYSPVIINNVTNIMYAYSIVNSTCGATVTNMSITLSDAYNSTSITTFNATVDFNGTTTAYSTTNGTVSTNLSTQLNGTFNVTFQANNYFTTTYTNQNITAAYAKTLVPFGRVLASDYYDFTTISNFTVEYNGTNYTTTTGYIYVPVPGLLNATVYTPNYFNTYLTNSNASNPYSNATPYQAQITFNTTEIISGNAVTNFTVTTNSSRNTNNTILYIKAGTYNLTWNKTGWYNKTQSFTFTALENDTQTFSGVYYQLLNITSRNRFTGANDTTFAANVSSGLYGYNTTGSTSNGSVLLPWINDTNINITTYNSSSFALASTLYNTSNFTGQPKQINITVLTYTTNTILFGVFDETTQALIATNATSIYLTGTLQSYNISTNSSGQYNLSLITPDTYIITFTSPGYNQRQIIYTLVNQSANPVNLYLLTTGNSTIITTSFRNQNYQAIVGTNVTLSRKNLTGTNYYDVYGCTADANGVCLINALINTATYKLCYTYGPFSSCSGDIQFTSADASVGRNFQLITTSLTNQVYVWNTLGQTAAITFYPNSTNFNGTIVYTVQNPSLLATSGCLVIYRTTGNNQVMDSTTCTTSQSTIISLTGYINTTLGGDSVQAYGYVTTGGVQTLIAYNNINLNNTTLSTTGKRLSLLVVVLAVIFTLIFSYSWNPIAPPIIAGFVIYVFYSIGLLVISWTTVIGIVLIPVIAWMMMGRRT